MEFSFEGRGLTYRGEAAPAEKSEDDKHNPWTVRIQASGPDADPGPIEGRLQVTDLAVEEAGKRGGADDVLGAAFARSFVAELGLRPLRSGFDFIVDHRWVTGYDAG